MESSIVQNFQYPKISKELLIADAGIVVFQFHLERMLTNERGTILGEDIEALHDMRVASRRLRVAVELFGNCYKRSRMKKISKGLRSIGKNLGNVRDLDVIIERITGYLNDPSQMYGADLQFLIESLVKKRNLNRDKLVIFLRSESYKSSIKIMKKFAKSPKYPKNANCLFDQICEFSNNKYIQQKAEIEKFDAIIVNPTIGHLHKLRNEFKRLRYTVEFFIDLFGNEGLVAVEFLKSVQDHLGVINDISMVIREIESIKKNSEECGNEFLLKHKGIIRFESKIQEELKTLIQEFPRLWKRYQEINIIFEPGYQKL